MWAVKPYYLGPWTLSARFGVAGLRVLGSGHGSFLEMEGTVGTVEGLHLVTHSVRIIGFRARVRVCGPP